MVSLWMRAPEVVERLHAFGDGVDVAVENLPSLTSPLGPPSPLAYVVGVTTMMVLSRFLEVVEVRPIWASV